MSRWPRWIVHALSPTPRELDAVDPGPPSDLVEIARQATTPLVDEVAMMVRPPLPEVRRSSPSWVVPVALVALAVAMFWVYWPQPQHTDLPMNQEIRLVGRDHVLGPDIDFRGIGEVNVQRAGSDGNIVRLVRGAVHFEVDPAGTQRALRVLAGETVVEVRGTIFSVFYIDGIASVDVARGRVSVNGPTYTGSLTAGQSWTQERPDQIVVVEVPSDPTVQECPPSAAVVNTDSPVAEPDAVAAYTAIFDQLDHPDVFPRELLREMEDFLAKYPSSPLVEEVTALHLEVDARVRPVWQIVPDIDTFLDEHAQTPRRLSLLELRATLLRENQDCEGALPTYRILATEGSGQLRARAEAWRGLCAHQLGNGAEARLALATALTLGVKHPLEAEVRIALESMQ